MKWQIYPCSGGATLAGSLAFPQSGALSVEISSDDREPVHLNKQNPVVGILEGTMVHRSYKGSINLNLDLIFAWPPKFRRFYQITPFGYVDRRRRRGGACRSPGSEERLGGVGIPIGFGTEFDDVECDRCALCIAQPWENEVKEN